MDNHHFLAEKCIRPGSKGLLLKELATDNLTNALHWMQTRTFAFKGHSSCFAISREPLPPHITKLRAISFESPISESVCWSVVIWKTIGLFVFLADLKKLETCSNSNSIERINESIQRPSWPSPSESSGQLGWLSAFNGQLNLIKFGFKFDNFHKFDVSSVWILNTEGRWEEDRQKMGLPFHKAFSLNKLLIITQAFTILIFRFCFAFIAQKECALFVI